MTRAEELLETFKDVSIGTELTGAEITKRVNSKFGRGKDSVNPADYLYTGYIYQKPKGSCEIIVGEVFEGKIVFLNQDGT